MLRHQQGGGSSQGPGFRIAAALFFALVWWVGCFFYWGDLGVYSDDWSISRVNVLTGETTMWRWPFEHKYFWRPLLQIFMTIMLGALWEKMWLFHLANVALHAASALVLYRVCRGFGLGRHGAFAGALVFLLFPYQYEVIFWSTAMTTGIATLVCMWLVLCALKYAKGGAKDSGIHGLLKLFAVTFFMVCWYEQPGAIVFALPLLFMAVRPADQPLRASLARIFKMCLAVGIPMLVYIALLLGTVPEKTRGGSGTYITLSSVPARIDELQESLTWYVLHNIEAGFLGGLRVGWDVLGASGGLNGVLILAFMGIFGGFLVLALRGEAEKREWDVRFSQSVAEGEERGIPPRVGWVFAFSCVALVSAIVPIFPIRGQILEPRLSSYACIGLGVLVACVVEGMLRLSWGRVWWPLVRGGVGIGIALAGILGAVSMLGAQTAMRHRTRADSKQTKQLAKLAVNAPPETVFLALDDQYLSTRTGHKSFDRRLSGWLTATWSARPAIGYAMKRADVTATSRNMWKDLEIAACDEQGFIYTSNWPGAGETVPGGTKLTWDVCVPFVVQADGNVALVETIVMKRPDGSVLTVTPRRLKEMNVKGLRFEVKVGK